VVAKVVAKELSAFGIRCYKDKLICSVLLKYLYV